MSRRTRLTFLASVLVTIASSFGVASYAFGSNPVPHLRSDLPASMLPTFSLDQATAVRINDLIGAPGVQRFGITPDSYHQVRRLSDTPSGPFYLIPGSSGACVVGPSATACGEPGAPGETMIALVQATPDGVGVIGAGISTDGATQVSLKRGDGSPLISLPVEQGAFVLNESAGIKPPQLVNLQFTAVR